jgi:uncharacterized RDD family membrane protein YckC
MQTADAPKMEWAQISGFWRRLLAFVVDSVTLGILGTTLGFFLYDQLSSLGGWGRLLGFGIAVTYLGVMNSNLHGGQTLGKIALKIKVVSRDGITLTPPASFCRAGILCTPYFLNGAFFNAEPLQSWFVIVLVVLVFGVGASIVYLAAFNRRTRQSLHDLAVGSYVVRTQGEGTTLAVSPLWRGHRAVVILFVAAAAAAPLFTDQFAQSEPFVSLLPLQKALSSEPGVRHATVHVGWNLSTTVQKGSQSKTYLSARVVTDSRDVDPERLSNRVAQVVLDNYAEAAKKDVIAVSLAYGYDIGIASAWQSKNYSFSPFEWRQRTAPKSSGGIQPTGAKMSAAPDARRQTAVDENDTTARSQVKLSL